MKKKNILLILMVLLVSVLFPLQVKAEDPITFDVTFEKNGSDYVITGDDSDTSIYDGLKGMEPGDKADIVFTLKNVSGTEVAWWMRNDAIKSFEDTVEAENGVYVYELALVDAGGTEIVLYSSDAVGGEKESDNQGLHEATEALKDEGFFFLDQAASGKELQVKMHIELEGETQTNFYQEALAQLQFIFAAEVLTPGGDGKIIVYRIPRTGVDGRRELERKMTLDRIIMGISILGMLLALLYLFLLKKNRKKARNAAALILISLLVMPVFMEKVYAYDKYKVTMLAGNHGKLVDPETGNEVDKLELDFSPGQEWDPLAYQVVVTDSRYYVDESDGGKEKFHISGIEGPVEKMPIYEDTMFVVTYKIKGSLVAYTVHYVDEDGAQLLPDSIYHGNPGDLAVVSYLYKEGYIPDRFTDERLLSADESENEFTFTYKKVEEGEGEGGTTIIYEYEDGPAPSSGSPVRPSQGSQDSTKPDGENAPEETEEIVEPETPETAPNEVVDPEPTVKPQPDKPNQPFVPMAILTGGGVLLLLGILLVLLRRRNKEKE